MVSFVSATNQNEYSLSPCGDGKGEVEVGCEQVEQVICSLRSRKGEKTCGGLLYLQQ